MPTKRVAEVDVTYRLTGEGQSTVFITQGLGFASAEWWPIQDALSKRARVLTWDRPGYGSSGSPTSPRTVRNIAAEALELLSDIAPEGPLVLVGHSQGGLYTNALARMAGAEFVASPSWTRLIRTMAVCVENCPHNCSGGAVQTSASAFVWAGGWRGST